MKMAHLAASAAALPVLMSAMTAAPASTEPTNPTATTKKANVAGGGAITCAIHGYIQGDIGRGDLWLGDILAGDQKQRIVLGAAKMAQLGSVGDVARYGD